jgi:multiple sugar transport system permease protein
MNAKTKRIVSTASRYLLILMFCIPMILPILWMITTGLKDNNAVFKMPPQWIPDTFHWENFTKGLEKVDFWRRFACTTFISLLCCIGQVMSCMSVGYALARMKFKGKKLWFYMIIGSMMIPGMVTVIPVFKLYSSLGWYNTWLPLIVPAFLGAPFQTFLVRQFLTTIPRSYDEAARIDGASRLQILTRIIVPMSKPLIVVILIQSFQGSWNDYLTPLLYLKNSNLWTLALAIGRFGSSTYGTTWNLYMAACLIYILPVIILFFLCQDYFMEGLGSMNNSGVK